jgi:ABC-2 type transport system permease protein
MALAWIAGAAFIGVALGLAGQGALEQFGQSGGLDFWAERTGADDPTEIFFRLVVYELSVFSVSLYAIMTVLRLRGEEATELLLSGPVSRTRWAVSHLAPAVAVPVAVLVVAGLGLGLGSGDFAGTLALTTVILPGVWVMAGIAMAAFGLFRRAGAVVVWTVLVLAIALEVGWEVGLVSDSLFMISPFAHVHYSTLADPGPGTLLGLTLVAAAFTATGLYGLRRRDLAM